MLLIYETHNSEHMCMHRDKCREEKKWNIFLKLYSRIIDAGLNLKTTNSKEQY